MDHIRHRKIISPAFNFGQIRDYVPIFNYHAAKVSVKLSFGFDSIRNSWHTIQLATKWKECISESPDGQSVFNICQWYAKTSLDTLGIGASVFCARHLFSSQYLHDPQPSSTIISAHLITTRTDSERRIPIYGETCKKSPVVFIKRNH